MKSFFYFMAILIAINTNQVFAAEAGMPQLDPKYWSSQIFWLVLTFAILYLVTWKIFLPKITYSVENRKSRIVNDLNEAQKLKESAEKKLMEYNKIIQQAKKDAKKFAEDSKKKLDKDIEIKKQKFNQEIDKELIAVEKEIAELKKNSISNINKISVEISEEVIKQIIGTDVNKSSVSAIVSNISKGKTENYL